MHRLSRLRPITGYFMLVISLLLAVTARAVNYPLAKALAPQLRPLGLTAKADPKGLEQVKGQIIRILNAMQSSAKSGGPDGYNLVGKAFDFQPAVGSTQSMTMQRNLVQMWQEAQALGCFNDKHEFTGAISKYADAGSQAVFEYIVPVELAPRFSRDISNVRLVSPSNSRVKGGSNNARDLAFIQQLRLIEREVDGQKLDVKVPTNNLGQTKQEAAQIFQAEMERAGAVAQQPPHLKLSGRLTQQPMKRNGYQWVYAVDLVNTSPHPTEVTVQWWLIGDTEIKHINYLMAEGSEKVSLRSMGTYQMPFKTKSQNHYDNRADDLDGLGVKDPLRGKTETKYRGAVIRVIHGKDQVVATWTSDSTMARCLSPEPEAEYDLQRLPKLHENPPKK